jgi:uncharacterized YkwD family protein
LNHFKKLVLVSTLAMSSIIGAGVASASSNTVMDKDTQWTISQYKGISLTSLFQSNQQVTNLNNILSDLLKNIPNLNIGSIPKAVPNTTTHHKLPTTTTHHKLPTTTTQPTTPNTSTQPKTPNTSTQTTFATQVVNLVNQERSKAGLNALTNNSPLSEMALVKAKDMYNNNYFDHNSPSYGSPFDMMKSYGIQFTYAGENIAKGQRSPQEVMTAWMNSAGHRENILNPNFTKIGVAYYNGEWVQEFIAN